MWDGLFMLLSLSAVMAFASFLVGSLPLSLSLSQRQLRFLSSLGAGVLVGTALIVIIPEGIETLYNAGEHEGSHARRTANTVSADSNPAEEHAHHGPEPHAYVGLSLVLGFILMYLIDVLPSHLTKQSASYRPLQISLQNISQGLYHPSSPTAPSSPGQADEAPRAPSTTIGLIIHAVADGIALGASSTGPASSSLGIVIFLAIMLHKAPAAFGLTSVLLKEGISKRAARTHLAIFSLAAPVGAFGTWITVNILGTTRLGGDEGMLFATGCVLLFSGGTFLFVAFHSLQEAQGASRNHESTNGFSNPYSPAGPSYHAEDEKPTLGEAGVVVLGMLIPLVTQLGGHGH